MAMSLHSLATDPSSYELLLAFDQDDTTTLDRWASTVVAEETNWRAIVVARLGYSSMNVYLNMLAELARGDWLFLLGDDAFVKTKGWDSRIVSQPCDRILNTSNTSDPEYSRDALMHPVLPRSWAVAMGRVSPYQQSDTYLTMLGRFTGRVDMSWAFDICHVEEDATPSQRVQDEVTAEIKYANNLPINELERDVRIISEMYR